jgi:hypothetical protein
LSTVFEDVDLWKNEGITIQTFVDLNGVKNKAISQWRSDDNDFIW